MSVLPSAQLLTEECIISCDTNKQTVRESQTQTPELMIQMIHII